jgi:predicted ATP-dependent endonuclease of OLD family
MQRKVFEFLYDYAVENDITIFLTTHSHVAINCFYGKPQACIFHVIKNNGTAEVKHIESYLDKVEILSDLDVKASDILQANGIIWVEGPSDRIYIKRWLEIFTDNRFKEGQHYQFLYYGGRLLSQYALKEDTDLISILTTNRNAAIVIDSDKRNMQASINSTKKRIVKEFDALQMFSWVTKGKEIENYITAGTVSAKFERKVNQCDRYELFPDYISRLYSGFTSKKVQFAGEISPYITLENTRGHLDLEEKIKKLYTQIEKWNGMQML